MKLYKRHLYCTAIKAFNEENAMYVETTLSDIRAAAKEMGYDLVPIQPKPRYKAHYGGPQPVGDDVRVEVVFRDGESAGDSRANCWFWGHFEKGSDIIAYRVLEKDE